MAARLTGQCYRPAVWPLPGRANESGAGLGHILPSANQQGCSGGLVSGRFESPPRLPSISAGAAFGPTNGTGRKLTQSREMERILPGVPTTKALPNVTVEIPK